MPFYVYVLELQNGKHYIGQTNNLERRLEDHRSGRSRPYARKNLMVNVLYSATYENKSESVFEPEKRFDALSI
jgi:predicted GIY-YIG superfamily endonuclease